MEKLKIGNLMPESSSAGDAATLELVSQAERLMIARLAADGLQAERYVALSNNGSSEPLNPGLPLLFVLPLM